MPNRKIIDIEPKSKIKNQENDFYEDLPKITPLPKRKRKDVFITILIIFAAFLVASGITKYSSQIQPDIKSKGSSNESELKFTRSSDTDQKTTAEQFKENANSDPFKPLTMEDAKEVVKTDTEKKEEIAKNSFKIRILNGNGITGDAAKLKTDLTSKGYDVGTVGNAKLKYALTQVYYLVNYQKQADIVAKDLSPRKTEVKEAEGGLIGSNYHILVVGGKE